MVTSDYGDLEKLAPECGSGLIPRLVLRPRSSVAFFP